MRALISVSDKTGVVEFARELEQLGVQVISTGGTHKKLEEAGIDVTGISDVTGFPGWQSKDFAPCSTRRYPGKKRCAGAYAAAEGSEH